MNWRRWQTRCINYYKRGDSTSTVQQFNNCNNYSRRLKGTRASALRLLQQSKLCCSERGRSSSTKTTAEHWKSCSTKWSNTTKSKKKEKFLDYGSKSWSDWSRILLNFLSLAFMLYLRGIIKRRRHPRERYKTIDISKISWRRILYHTFRWLWFSTR